MNHPDKCTIVALVTSILDRGYAYSITDVETSIFDDEPTLYKDMHGLTEFGHCDDDFVVVKDISNNEPLCVFHLIYSNGNEFDPIVTISDYSAGDIAQDLYDQTGWRLFDGNFTGLAALHREGE